MKRNQPRRGRKEPRGTGAGAAKTQSLTREVKVSGVRSKERVGDRLSQEEARRCRCGAMPQGNGKAPKDSKRRVT